MTPEAARTSSAVVPVGEPEAVSAVIGDSFPGSGGDRLVEGLLETLPMAVAIRRVGPGCPVEVANERFRLWLDSLTAADGSGGVAVADEVVLLVSAAVRTGRPRSSCAA